MPNGWSCSDHIYKESCRHDLIDFYNQLYFEERGIKKLLYMEQREEMVVLSLYDGISSGEKENAIIAMKNYKSI